VPNDENIYWARYSDRLPSCRLGAIDPTDARFGAFALFATRLGLAAIVAAFFALLAGLFEIAPTLMVDPVGLILKAALEDRAKLP
jgi:hypothetical protein